MLWFDELRLSRLTVEEIGICFYIREMMKNSWHPTYAEACETFGAEWRTKLQKLVKEGVLNVEYRPRTVSLKVVAPGDVRRCEIRQCAAKLRQRKAEGKR